MTKSDKYFKDLKNSEYFLSDMDLASLKSDAEHIKKMDAAQVQAGLTKMRTMLTDGSIAPDKKNGAVEVMKLLSERAGQLQPQTKESPQVVLERLRREKEITEQEPVTTYTQNADNSPVGSNADET